VKGVENTGAMLSHTQMFLSFIELMLAYHAVPVILQGTAGGS
jgi:hypothetical protein